MPVCHILQTEIYPSRVYDDTLDNTQAMTAATLEEDLNYIRTVLKMIGGGANWYTPDITQSLGQLEDDFQVEHYTTSEDPTLAGQHKNIHADSIRSKSWVSAFEYLGLLNNSSNGWIFYYDRTSTTPFYVRILPASSGTAEWENYFEVSRAGSGIKTRIVNEPIDNTYDLELFKPYDGGTVHATKIRFHQENTYWSIIKADVNGISIRTGDDTAYHRFNAGDGHFYNGLYANQFVQSTSFRLVGALTSHPTGYDGIFYRYNNEAYLQVQGNLFIRDETAGEKFHFVTDTGRLGINKTNPSCALDVQGSACIRNDLSVNGDLTVAGSLSFPFLEDVLIPPEYNSIGLSYNLLAGAQQRFSVTVSGSGSLSTEVATNLKELFNSRGNTFTSTNSVDPSDPLVIEIDTNDVHTQTKKATFGWTSRYWYPTSFKVEAYDYNSSTWVTIDDVTSWNKRWYAVDIDNFYLGGIRLTIRETAASDNRLQLSQVFLLHPEAAGYSDVGDLVVGNEIIFPANNSTSDTSRTVAVGRNRIDKSLYMWAYANDYILKFGSKGTTAAYADDNVWDFLRRVRIRGTSIDGGKIYLYDSRDRYVFGLSGGRFYIAPYDDGAWQWSREFGYRPDNNRWYAETAFEAAAFYETSSRKYKEKIREYKDSALELLRKVNVVRFYFKNNDKKEHIGFIAEDSPKEFVDETGERVDTGTVLGVLVKAIQELLEKVEKLEKQVAGVAG